MFNYDPCLDCKYRLCQLESQEVCVASCRYAYIKSLLRTYGTLEEIVSILKGDSFPVVLIDKDHLDSTYRIVCAAKDGFI